MNRYVFMSNINSAGSDLFESDGFTFDLPNFNLFNFDFILVSNLNLNPAIL